jgi:hypothetical protein
VWKGAELMFYVKLKNGPYRREEVYAVREIHGDIQFLFHNGVHWVWDDADNYEPIN